MDVHISNFVGLQVLKLALKMEKYFGWPRFRMFEMKQRKMKNSLLYGIGRPYQKAFTMDLT
jgi:hypothetical protein